MSERIRKYGVNMVVEGDLVFEEGNCVGDEGEDDMNGDIWVSMLRVCVVIVEEVVLGVIDSSFVVLSFFGNSIMYLINLGDVYDWFVVEDGISLNIMMYLVCEFVINLFIGDYCRCFFKFINVSYIVISYADAAADLVLIDFDCINGIIECIIEDGFLCVVMVKFILFLFFYVIMVFWELMKANISVSSYKRKTFDARAAVFVE